MKNIKSEDLLKTLQDLKVGETIFIPIDKDLCNVIQLMDLQLQSYNNLYLSYMNNTSEEAYKLNLDKFLDKYSELYSRMIIVKKEILNICIGDANKYFNKTPFNYNFDLNLNVLQIKKMGGK